jgi:hypothetical protein
MKISDAIEQYGRSLLDDDRQRFYTLAAVAIRSGQLTAEERDAICMPTTSGQNYWCRHLRDLRDLLAQRSNRRK